MIRIFNRGSLTRWDTLVESDGGSETMELLAIFELVKLDLFNLFKHVWTGELMLETPTDSIIIVKSTNIRVIEIILPTPD